jgi:hypothetical protein
VVTSLPPSFVYAFHSTGQSPLFSVISEVFILEYLQGPLFFVLVSPGGIGPTFEEAALADPYCRCCSMLVSLEETGRGEQPGDQPFYYLTFIILLIKLESREFDRTKPRSC